MDTPLPPILVFLLISISRLGSAVASTCPRTDLPSLALRGIDSSPRCPLSIVRYPPQEINGEALEKVLTHGQRRECYSIFFYASWCPFSRHSLPLFDALSSMFPQIRHFAVEESSAQPRVFSMYGVRSFPTILVVNRTRRIPYHGTMDLSSLLYFYKRTTGFEPAVYLSEHYLESGAMPSKADGTHSPWVYSPKELLAREPYLVLSALFIVFRVFLYLFPGIFSKLRAFYYSCVRNLSLVIFGGLNQLLGRVLQAMNVARLWSKLGLFNKTRNFQRGANNARVWASSLASVSLSESTSSRSSTSDS